MDDTEVRLIRGNEIEAAFKLLDQEKDWNVKIQKFAKVQETFPESVFVAVKKNEEIVGVASVVPSSKNEFVLGNVVVAKHVRGMGLGKTLIKKAMASLPENASTTFFSVQGLEKFYDNQGFVRMDKSQDIEIHRLRVDMNGLVTSALPQEHVSVVTYTRDLLEPLQARTRSHNTEKYFRIMTETSDDFLVALNTDTKQVLGYVAGVVKEGLLKCDGLFAVSDEIATLLFGELITRHPDLVHNVQIQIPPSRRFLLQFGDQASSYSYTRYTYGKVRYPPLHELYCATDCDYSF